MNEFNRIMKIYLASYLKDDYRDGVLYTTNSKECVLKKLLSEINDSLSDHEKNNVIKLINEVSIVTIRHRCAKMLNNDGSLSDDPAVLALYHVFGNDIFNW